jgi:tetratricopeptide (TPR) repeat protein
MASLLLWLALLAQDPRELGREALAEGRLDEAEAHLTAALAANPPRVFEIHYALGRLYLQKRDYPRARQSFDECLARAPRFAPALVGRARASLFLEDVDQALEDLTAAKSFPEAPPEAELLGNDLDLFLARGAGASSEPIQDLASAREYLRWGATLLSRGETNTALRPLRIASAIDDQNPIPFLFLTERGEAPPSLYPTLPAEFRRAREALERNDLDGARASAEAILEKRPAFVPARLLLLESLGAAKRPVEALVQYEKLVQELPPVFEVEARAGRLAHEVEAHGLAECHARRALELKPRDPAMLFLLAESQLGAGEAQEAIATCEGAIASGVATAPLYFTLGNALHGRMEIGASIAALRKAVELDPQAAEDIAAFALSSLTTEDYRNLRELLEAHVETHRDNVNTSYSLGVMSLREGDLDEARGYLERVRELAPREVQAHYNLALLHQRAGRDDLAREAMARFQELKAEEDALWREGHRLSNLRIRAASAELDERIAILTELVKSPTEETPSDYVLLGEALFAAGRLEEARSAFERARTQRARDASALEGLSRVEAALGDSDKAAAHAEAAALLKRRCRREAPGREKGRRHRLPSPSLFRTRTRSRRGA